MKTLNSENVMVKPIQRFQTNGEEQTAALRSDSALLKCRSESTNQKKTQKKKQSHVTMHTTAASCCHVAFLACMQDTPTSY